MHPSVLEIARTTPLLTIGDLPKENRDGVCRLYPDGLQEAVDEPTREGPPMIGPIHAWSTIASAFLASSVEAVEALTVVLAVGVVRGWRSALLGTVGALGLLAALVAVFGLALASIPVAMLQLVVGTLLLLFGIRWLRKAMLRSAGVIDLHDEEALYQSQVHALSGNSAGVPPNAGATASPVRGSGSPTSASESVPGSARSRASLHSSGVPSTDGVSGGSMSSSIGDPSPRR